MTNSLRIVLAQHDFLVGAIEKNLAAHINLASTARDQLNADLIIFPELSLTGYPPEDLLLREYFISTVNQALITLKNKIKNIYCLIGHPLKTEEGLFNAASLIFNGEIVAQYRKRLLPNYEVFDEQRYFIPGEKPCVVPIKNISLGIVICEDLWQPEPVLQTAKQGAQLILAINASPFETDKHQRRINLLNNLIQEIKIPIIYNNCVGGQDDLIFDGGSMALDSDGQICQFAGFFKENLLCVDLTIEQAKVEIKKSPITIPKTIDCIYQALVTGTRDYIEKNKFPGALIGVSGGIDSALTLAIAVDALGAERVRAIMLPSRYTSQLSMEEALAITQNLNVAHEIISIEEPFNSFLKELSPRLMGRKPDVVQENLQARCRGIIMMAISNQTKKIVLTTGNRSEMAVGYATLYGDMAGGFSVLKDVSKTDVYRLANYRNQISPVIPERTITREPTAELALEQKDSDTLPPYEILDEILKYYIDQELSLENITEKGFDRATVQRIINLVQQNEYKRRQAAVGVRIHSRAFGRDRRYPITCGFKES